VTIPLLKHSSSGRRYRINDSVRDASVQVTASADAKAQDNKCEQPVFWTGLLAALPALYVLPTTIAVIPSGCSGACRRPSAYAATGRPGCGPGLPSAAGARHVRDGGRLDLVGVEISVHYLMAGLAIFNVLMQRVSADIT